jgi:phosphate transport system substrate-binding protein
MNPKKKSELLLITTTALLVIALTLSSCSSASPTSTPTPSSQPPVASSPTTNPSVSQLSGTITEAGSTTVQPLAEKFAAAFMKANPKVTVTIQGGGTGVGIKSAQDGTVDIGAASRELNAEEAKTLTPWVLARDGIAIIVNPKNTLSGLTRLQVRSIFAGNVTNWKDVGGLDAKINLVSREEGSGTRTAFQELVMRGTPSDAKTELPIVNSAIFQSSNGAIKQVVMGDANAIGYLSLGYLDNSVKALPVDGVAPTEENSKSGKYPIVRPLYFVTNSSKTPTGVVKAFLDYCQSADAQTIITSEGYVSVK